MGLGLDIRVYVRSDAGCVEPNFHTHSIPCHALKSLFEVPGSWVTLGGSPAGAAYLEKQHTAVSLLQSPSCSDAEEDHATAVCSKHLDEGSHPETFADCVYDLCHGGDESFAQSAAAFLMPLDNSA